DRLPILHAVAPDEGAVVDHAAPVELDELASGNDALIALADIDRPAATAERRGELVAVQNTRGGIVVVGCSSLGGSRGGGFRPLDDDGGAALLAANLDDFSTDLLVRDRVLR